MSTAVLRLPSTMLMSLLPKSKARACAMRYTEKAINRPPNSITSVMRKIHIPAVLVSLCCSGVANCSRNARDGVEDRTVEVVTPLGIGMCRGLWQDDFYKAILIKTGVVLPASLRNRTRGNSPLGLPQSCVPAAAKESSIQDRWPATDLQEPAVRSAKTIAGRAAAARNRPPGSRLRRSRAR